MSGPYDGIGLVDPELMVVKFLRTALADDGINVGLVLPAAADITSSLPFVTVTTSTGFTDMPARFDYPVIDLNVYELTNEAVNDAGRAVLSAAYSLREHRDDDLPPAGAEIPHVQVVARPQRLPEDEPLVRLQMQVRLTVHSFPS